MNKTKIERCYEANMSVLRLNSDARPLQFLEMWEVQNKAWCEDCAPGVLLDSLLYRAKRGYMAFYETPVNANQSTYTMVFLPYDEEVNEIHALFWDLWESERGVYDE